MRKKVVPLGVAALVLGLFWWSSGSEQSPLHEVESDVRSCKENLRAIYTGLCTYRDRVGHAPEQGGVGFIAELIASGTWEDSPESRALLTCTGPGAIPVPPGTDYTNIESLSPEASAYTAVDTTRQPVTKFPSGGPEQRAIVACDNATGMNHEGILNVLYSDGSVKTFSLERLITQGILEPGTQTIPVGSESPLEELRALVAE